MEKRESEAKETKMWWVRGNKGFKDRDEKEMKIQKIQNNMTL